MRLLRQDNDGEITLANYTSTPPYAIFSHTSELDDEEVTLRNIENGTGRNKVGYNKIRFCGQQALSDGLQFFWVDTCCIDRSSSSELSEAINSMFHWYQNAQICYVYLSDVARGGGEENADLPSWMSSFRESRWFTRTWSLQELLAPKSVIFFSSDGRRLGDKSSMEQELYEITGISIQALRGSPLSDFSPSERMSWAAKQVCIHGEDKAYSLLGLFNVSMPIIYGEGETRAIQRIQEEIRKSASKALESTRVGMRLLIANSDPLRMETIPVSDNLQYAILSHTWGDDEVLFDDMRDATAEQRRAYSKIRQCCNLAVTHGFNYVWVDTCCIDKSSSSELQEAICSMYKWYKNAAICYVYLENCNYGDVNSFIRSRWFKRGWTLQELIAPPFIEFYDQNWNGIGTKLSLCDQIAKITSIDPAVLRGADPTSRSVAERMSWAAYRRTTRTEDAAYSLMGLFNVFMPMLYGEGSRAFIRLQEETIKQTEDYTIFSWKANILGSTHRGIFAHSPAEFSTVEPDRIVPRFRHPRHQLDQHPPPALTSRGLVLTLLVLENLSDGTILGWVSCSRPKEEDLFSPPALLCVRLREIQSNPQVFARTSPEKLSARMQAELENFKQRTVCVLPSNDDTFPNLDGPDLARKCEIEVCIPDEANSVVAPMKHGISEWAVWRDEEKTLTYSYQAGTCHLAAIRFRIRVEFVVVIGLHENKPWCAIVAAEDIDIQENTLRDQETLFGSPTSNNLTDRAWCILSTTKVSAALRVAPSTELDTPKFSLRISAVEVKDSSCWNAVLPLLPREEYKTPEVNVITRSELLVATNGIP